MAIKHKRGDVVRQIAPVIQGEIVNMVIVDDEVQFEVAYLGTDGEAHSRFFKEEEIEPVQE